MAELADRFAGITLREEPRDDPSQASNYYETRQASRSVNFARLEKGLLLFIYIHETTKDVLYPETTLWDRRVCVNVIKDGQCTKPRDQCRRGHDAQYRQADICTHWYNYTCRYPLKCRFAHSFTAVAQHHRYILTDADNKTCKLIRFVRNFAGHYIDSAIPDGNDVQALYQEMVVLMSHLVHALSRKRASSIDHLNLFLEATTVKQMIGRDALLRQLDKPYAVPEVFLQPNVDFTTHWYQRGASRRSVDFKDISAEFRAFFNDVFTRFYQGRLQSRGAPTAWD